jgi:hypothetical protein
MFQGMSERNLKERVLDQCAKDKKDVEDRMFGPGGKVLGAIVVIPGIWAIVRLFWS